MLLSDWLDTPNYDQGVLLYEKLIGKGFLLSMLMKGADEYNRAKLHEALNARHDQLSAELKAKKSAYPDQLKSQLAGAGRLMDERVVLKEQMRSLWLSGTSQGDELQDKAFRVLAITDELDTIYGQKDFFHAHGYLPDEDVAVSQLSAAELIARRNTLRTYCSRLPRQIIRTSSQKRKAELADRLEGFRKELYTIEQHLKS